MRVTGIITVAVDDSHSFLLESRGSRIENDLYWRGYGQGWEAMSLRLWRHSRLALENDRGCWGAGRDLRAGREVPEPSCLRLRVRSRCPTASIGSRQASP